jgi:hypothetical protein
MPGTESAWPPGDTRHLIFLLGHSSHGRDIEHGQVDSRHSEG